SHYLEDALANAQRGLPPRLIRQVQGCLAERDLLSRRPGEALDRLHPILSAPEGREGTDATPLLALLSWAHLEAGTLQLEEMTIREALDRCRTEHHQLALVDALRIQALLAIRQERWQEAEAALEEALTLTRAMSYPYAEAKTLHSCSQLHAARGDS